MRRAAGGASVAAGSGWGVDTEVGEAGWEGSSGSCRCPGEGVWTTGILNMVRGLGGGGGARYKKLGGAHSGASRHLVTR